MKSSFLPIALVAALSLAASGAHAGEYSYSEGSEGKAVDLGPGASKQFPFRFSLDVLQGYDDNVSTSNVNEEESLFTSVRVGTVGAFGTPRTKLTLDLGAGATYFWDREGDDIDYSVSAGLGLTHRLSPRLLLTLTSSQQIQSEPDFALVGAASRRTDGEYLYGVTRLDLAYQWTARFQTVSSYSFINVIYFENEERRTEDRFEHYVSQQFRYLWTPTTTLVAEYRFGYVDVLDVARDSHSNYFLVGADSVLSPRLSGGFRVGAEIREFEQGSSRTSPFGEGNLAYAYGPNGSQLQLVTRYGQELPDDALSQSRDTFRIGLKLNHGFTPRLSGQLETYYQNNEVNGRGGVQDGFQEDIYSVVVGARFLVTENLSLRTGYSFTMIDSDDSFREYERNRIWIGAALMF